jgi:hypothetical protein
MSVFDIRSQIRPFPRIATYPTGWAGNRTFAEIMDDCTPLAGTGGIGSNGAAKYV